MANKNREKNINNNGLPVCNINWYLGHMAKYYLSNTVIDLILSILL